MSLTTPSDFAGSYPEAASLGIAVAETTRLYLPFLDGNVGDYNGGHLHSGVLCMLVESCARYTLQKQAGMEAPPEVVSLSLDRLENIGPVALVAEAELFDHGRGAVSARVHVWSPNDKDKSLVAQASVELVSPGHGSIAIYQP